jgi:hypothetical protein
MQRTAWRYKTLKHKDIAIVFSGDKQKEVHFKVRTTASDGAVVVPLLELTLAATIGRL